MDILVKTLNMLQKPRMESWETCCMAKSHPEHATETTHGVMGNVLLRHSHIMIQSNTLTRLHRSAARPKHQPAVTATCRTNNAWNMARLRPDQLPRA